MKLHRIAYMLLFFSIISCSNDDKAIDALVEETERGAVLRNINKVSKDFIHNNFESAFDIEIEEQDLEDGALLDFVRLYVAFRDHTSGSNDNSVQEIMLRDIPSSEFVIGPDALPRTTVRVTYQDVVDALSINTLLIEPGDQFSLRMEIHLTDDRTFDTMDTTASILTDACFFKSPLRYEINVIEVISDDLFTGIYSYEVITDTNSSNAAISNQGIVSITVGDLPNVRKTSIIGEGLEFTVAGNNVYPKIYQSVNLFCIESGPHILSGPNDTNFGMIDLNDDSLFFLDLDVGFEGWDGTLEDDNTAVGIPTLYTFKFSKQ
ncbi:hypothetical protein [Dokdonia sp.]|uniref:hypothetical protein n=1 Tax=Dokdonia sp. TaxID=2024995 RepID=UPI00326499BC